jgi:hypothetical protein
MTTDVAALATPGMLWCGDVVVIGQPEPRVPPPLDVPGKVDRVAERVGGRSGGGDGGEVEDGVSNGLGGAHAGW